MEDDALERVRRGMDAWNKGDLEAWLALNSPGVLARAALARSVYGGEYRGHEGLRRWWDDYHDAFDTVRLYADEAHPLDDGRLLVLGHVFYRGSTSGIEQERPWGWIVTFDAEGLTVLLESYDDPAAARAAAGLAGPASSD